MMLDHSAAGSEVLFGNERKGDFSSEHEAPNLLDDLLNDFRKYVPSRGDAQDKNFILNEFRIVSDKPTETKIDKAHFKELLGEKTAAFLEKLGCNEISKRGDHIKMNMDGSQTIDIDNNGIKDIKLSKQIDFNVARAGDKINITDVKGVRVNPKVFFEFDMPDFTITRQGIDLGSLIPNVSAPGLYDQMSELLEKLNK